MQTIIRLALMLLVTAAVHVPAWVHADHVPAVTVMDADELKRWIDSRKPFVLLDSRVAAEYKAGHIPTAINILAAEMEKQRNRLPADKKTILVFYCNGWPECKKSHVASAQAVAWGYENVFWLREGLPAWQAKGYPVE